MDLRDWRDDASDSPCLSSFQVGAATLVRRGFTACARSSQKDRHDKDRHKRQTSRSWKQSRAVSPANTGFRAVLSAMRLPRSSRISKWRRFFLDNQIQPCVETIDGRTYLILEICRFASTEKCSAWGITDRAGWCRRRIYKISLDKM